MHLTWPILLICSLMAIPFIWWYIHYKPIDYCDWPILFILQWLYCVVISTLDEIHSVLLIFSVIHFSVWYIVFILKCHIVFSDDPHWYIVYIIVDIHYSVYLISDDTFLPFRWPLLPCDNDDVLHFDVDVFYHWWPIITDDFEVMFCWPVVSWRICYSIVGWPILWSVVR